MKAKLSHPLRLEPIENRCVVAKCPTRPRLGTVICARHAAELAEVWANADQRRRKQLRAAVKRMVTVK